MKNWINKALKKVWGLFKLAAANRESLKPLTDWDLAKIGMFCSGLAVLFWHMLVVFSNIFILAIFVYSFYTVISKIFQIKDEFKQRGNENA